MKRKASPETVLRLVAVAAVAASLYGASAMASERDNLVPSNQTVLSPDQIAKSLLDQGYAKVIRMEMEDGVYEVKVKTAKGERRKLNVDPATGKVLGTHEDGFFSR